MNRSAKGFRVVSGLFILLNLAAFFFPVTGRVQENYAAIKWYQLDYIKSMFGGSLPYDGKGAGITVVQTLWILCFVVLPLFLAMIAGIWGIIGNYKQRTSSILAFAVFTLYIGMFVSLGILWPDAAEGQVYRREMACMLHLIFSGCGVALAAAALLCTPKEIKAVKNSIPQVREIKQQQVEAKYNIIIEKSKEKQVQPSYVPGNPRGVLVGLTGIYAGAEIPLTSGEYIKLGRQTNNHLVFEGQPNVSRNHCRIKWDAGRKKYTFCDYSSNGSFVNNSDECLPQNLEIDMEPGTVVAIGDERNTFRLE